MSISTVFQLYRGGQFFVWRKLEYTGSPTCCKSLTTLSHKVASSTPRHGLDSEVKAVYIAFVIFNDKLDLSFIDATKMDLTAIVVVLIIFIIVVLLLVLRKSKYLISI
jgi:hypothetical protein